MKNRKNTGFYRKVTCLFLISILMISVSGCRIPGMPDKDPVNTLRTYYKEGKYDKARGHYITFKLIAETSDISYPDSEVRTLSSQMGNGEYEDVRHTLYHIALWDQSTTYIYHPMLTLDLIHDGDWKIDTENTIIAQHEDKVLAQVCYGAGKFATFIYSIKDDTLTEIEPNIDFAAYHNGIFIGDEDYIFADTVAYDVYDYHTLHWYDWNGNVMKQIDNAQAFFHNGEFYYVVCKNQNGLNRYDFYNAEYDGSDEKLIGSICEGGNNQDLKCFFDITDGPVINYQWNSETGEQLNNTIPISKFDTIVVN